VAPAIAPRAQPRANRRPTSSRGAQIASRCTCEVAIAASAKRPSSPAVARPCSNRAKDVIKSGGEWISTIDLENVAAGHPKIQQAAVICVPDPKWDERPLVAKQL